MCTNNYEKFKEKFCDRLAAWNNRGLSLLGKILVVNALLVSQLVYKMMMICDVNEDRYQQLKSIIVKFLWDDKRPKIAYSKLILTYEDGGLKLHDIKIKDISLKLFCFLKCWRTQNGPFTFKLFSKFPVDYFFLPTFLPGMLKSSEFVVLYCYKYWPTGLKSITMYLETNTRF